MVDYQVTLPDVIGLVLCWDHTENNPPHYHLDREPMVVISEPFSSRTFLLPVHVQFCEGVCDGKEKRNQEIPNKNPKSLWASRCENQAFKVKETGRKGHW